MGHNFTNAVHQMRKNNKTKPHVHLRSLIKSAITQYEKKRPQQRNEEKIEILNIMRNFNENEPLNSLKELRNNLKKYFNSKNYYRGYFGNSYLEDCTYAALFIYEEMMYSDSGLENNNKLKKQAILKSLTNLQSKSIIRQNLSVEDIKKIISDALKENNENWLTVVEQKMEVTFSPKDKKTIFRGLEKLEPYVKYSSETLSYHLSDVVMFAIWRYYDLNPHRSDKRKGNIKALEQMLVDEEFSSPKVVTETIAEIRNYLANNFSFFENSRLHNFVNKAINDFEKQSKAQGNQFDSPYKRVLKTKTWKNKESKKLVLALHGLGDSVDTFNGIAEQYVDAGYKVVAYDQAGHGYDERRNKEGLNLQQMQFDFYQMLEKQLENNEIEEIIILGHSLGGSLIANSLGTIKWLNNRSEEKIKKIQLIAPAAMKNPILQIISNLPTLLFKNAGDRTDSVEFTVNSGLRRVGGPSPMSAFGDLIEFIANAFSNLRAVFTRTQKVSIPLEIHYAEDDNLVKASNFKKLEKAQESVKDNKEKQPTSTISYGKGRHHLHAKNNYTLVMLIEKEEETTPQQFKL
jgi:alpha-beta hydrolase superfamily lysophospholipase